jgi:SAM-dependent methyltransferase
VPQDQFRGWVAEIYDTSEGEMFAPEVVDRTARFLAEVAAGGAALEFAIGTGRIALPLCRAGVRVAGIDISPDMVSLLRAKPGSDAIDVTIGDCATTRIPGTFSLVYIVFNSISNLNSQDEQVACFANAAAHLDTRGCFVVELWIPDLRGFPHGQTAQMQEFTDSHIGFDSLDPATQLGVSHHYYIDGDRVSVFDVAFRYAWPAELDLMARLAGLRLRERWADWDGSPFTSDSRKHVSVWEKAR